MKYDDLIKSLHICGDNTASCRGCLFVEMPIDLNCRKLIMNESANAIDDLQKRITSADVAPVRRARWKTESIGCYYCSLCNEQSLVRTNFCQHCGADMRGEIVEDRPLVEVPKHGRLIDADALPINTGWLEVSESTHDHITFVYAKDIYSAKTIIEAND